MKKSIFRALAFLFSLLLILQAISVNMHSKNTGAEYPAPYELTRTVDCLSGIYPKNDREIRIMSYNLLSDSAGFDGSPAYMRSEGVSYILNTLAPDVAGIQETSRNWFYCLNKTTDYAFIAPVRTTVYGTMTTIIYNTKNLILKNYGEYSFKNSYNHKLRCTVWGLFYHKSTDKVFAVVNTHFSLSERDYRAPMTQATELLNLAEKISNTYNCTVFFTGDFNAGERRDENTIASSVYETLCTSFTDTKELALTKSSGENLSVHSACIDHIFLKGDAQIRRYVILSQNELSPLSDHYPVFVDFLFQNC